MSTSHCLREKALAREAAKKGWQRTLHTPKTKRTIGTCSYTQQH
jgi:hypothetical protein